MDKFVGILFLPMVFPMTNSDLTSGQNFSGLFCHYVLANVQYWHEYVTQQSTDIAALDRERNRILKAISFALNLEIAWPCVYQVIVIFSSFMERRGYWESWNRLLDQALKVAQRLEDEAKAVTLSALLARLLQQQSCFRQAIACHRYTIRIARQIGDRYNEARACSNLSYLYIETGRWYRAEVLGCHALAIFEQLDDKHGRAHTENHLGILYSQQGRWEQARWRLERACALWQVMDDNNGLMRGFINLGMLYNEMEQPAESLSYLERALKLAKLTGEEVEIGAIYLNMGSAYQLTGDFTQAEACAWQAEAIFRRLSYSILLAEVWHNLGVVYTSQRRWADAHRYLEAAREAWRSQNKYYETRILKAMVEYELARDNRSGAMVRLNELECLINQHEQDARYHHLQMLVGRYRDRLAQCFT